MYFARPDSRLYGQSVPPARVRMGEQLAEQAPRSSADMVMGVPESRRARGRGLRPRSGIPYGQGLVKNRYIGRTFIAPSQEMRGLGVRMKLNPLRENIAGKRLVVVDDSIVRGTTTRAMVRMLREAGAAEVHLRIIVAALPLAVLLRHGHRRPRASCWPPTSTVEEIREYLDVDTLAYLTLDRLLVGHGRAGRRLLRRLPHRRLPGRRARSS